LQPVPVSSSGQHLNASVHCESAVKTESVPSISSQPVAELFACTVSSEDLSYVENKLAVGAEQFAVPVTLVFTAAGQCLSLCSDGAFLSSSSVPSLVVSSTDSTNISPSLFCPVIADVRSLKIEQDDHLLSAPSRTVLDECGARSSSSYSKCDSMERPTATAAVHCDDPNSFSTGVTSCSSSLVSCSEVSLRPLTSFADSVLSEVTETTDADKSIASAVIKQEFSLAIPSCLSSVKHLASTAVQSDGTHLLARNLTEIADRTDPSIVTRADNVDLNMPAKSAKIVDIVSARNVHTDSRKCSQSKGADADSSMKGKHLLCTTKRKHDAESGDSAAPQSASMCVYCCYFM